MEVALTFLVAKDARCLIHILDKKNNLIVYNVKSFPPSLATAEA